MNRAACTAECARRTLLRTADKSFQNCMANFFLQQLLSENYYEICLLAALTTLDADSKAICYVEKPEHSGTMPQ